MIGLVPLWEEVWISPLSLPIMWRYSKMVATCTPGSRLPPGSKSAGTLILDLVASKTVRNECLLFKPPSQWYFVLAARATIGNIPFCVLLQDFKGIWISLAVLHSEVYLILMPNRHVAVFLHISLTLFMRYIKLIRKHRFALFINHLLAGFLQ